MVILLPLSPRNFLSCSFFFLPSSSSSLPPELELSFTNQKGRNHLKHHHHHLLMETDQLGESTVVGFQHLNPDLLVEILKRTCTGNGVGGLRSHMRFSRVCSSWRSVAANNPYKLAPWLMLSKLKYNQKTRSLLSLDDKQIHEIKLSNEANSSWCSGSSEGWLVMTRSLLYNRINFLYNSITRARINLPPLDHLIPRTAIVYGTTIRTEPSLYLTKAIVITSSSLSSSLNSTSPSNHHPSRGSSDGHDHDDDIVAVAAIFAENQFICFCRPGDKEWQVFALCLPRPYPGRTPEFGENGEDDFVDDMIDDDDDYTAEYEVSTERPKCADIILYRGSLYVVMHKTAVVGVFKFDTSSGTTPRVIPEIQWLNMLPMNLRMICYDWNYLVESREGELLMVVRRRRRRITDNGQYYKSVKTWRFLVFKLDESCDPMKWVRIESLGDEILFLGINHSKSIRASDIPGSKGNCIYFTADSTCRQLWMQKTKWPYPGSSYTCNDVGVFYLEDGRIETTTTSFLTDDEDAGHDLGNIRKFLSTAEFPAIFITPNPSSSITCTHGNYSRVAGAAGDLYTLLSSSKCWRNAVTGAAGDLYTLLSPVAGVARDLFTLLVGSNKKEAAVTISTAAVTLALVKCVR